MGQVNQIDDTIHRWHFSSKSPAKPKEKQQQKEEKTVINQHL